MIIRQPNGLYAIYSNRQDTLTCTNLSYQATMEYLMNDYRMQAWDRLNNPRMRTIDDVLDWFVTSNDTVEEFIEKVESTGYQLSDEQKYELAQGRDEEEEEDV